MPFTPLHLGPGAALHATSPRRGSFLAFCAAGVLMDVEPLYHMLTDDPPLHRFSHTLASATLVAVATAIMGGASRLGRMWIGTRCSPAGTMSWNSKHALLGLHP